MVPARVRDHLLVPASVRDHLLVLAGVHDHLLVLVGVHNHHLILAKVPGHHLVLVKVHDHVHHQYIREHIILHPDQDPDLVLKLRIDQILQGQNQDLDPGHVLDRGRARINPNLDLIIRDLDHRLNPIIRVVVLLDLVQDLVLDVLIPNLVPNIFAPDQALHVHDLDQVRSVLVLDRALDIQGQVHNILVLLQYDPDRVQ